MSRKHASKWRYRCDISWIVNHKEMTLDVKASRIVKLLGKTTPFNSDTLNFNPSLVLEELTAAAATGSTEKFEEVLESLYATCDHLGIWLSATPAQS